MSSTSILRTTPPRFSRRWCSTTLLRATSMRRVAATSVLLAAFGTASCGDGASDRSTGPAKPAVAATAQKVTDPASLVQVKERLEAAGYAVKAGEPEGDQIEVLKHEEGPRGTFGFTIALYKTPLAAAGASESYGGAAAEQLGAAVSRPEQTRFYSMLSDDETLSAAARSDFERLVEIAEGRATPARETNDGSRAKAMACLESIGAEGPLDTSLPGKLRRNTPSSDDVIAVTLHRDEAEAAAELKAHGDDGLSLFDMQQVGAVTVWATNGNEKMLFALAECMRR